MIEKLNYGWQAGGGYVEPTSEILCDKINQLVDAVNAIQGDVKKTNSPWVHWETPTKNVRDEYAEQRGWIGKLCFFWDEFRTMGTYGRLSDIDEKNENPYKLKAYWWQHCEPVKPDSEIIYHGE